MSDHETSNLPPVIETQDQLEEVLSRPSSALVESMREMEGDLLILGVGGKMGPTLAKLSRRAMDQAGNKSQVTGVSRFSSGGLKDELESAGIATISCDLLNRDAVNALPDSPNVVFMAGMKFGSTGNESMTWAMNAYVPALIAERFRNSRIVVFSTGNVYHLAPVTHGGSTEVDATNPVGEYAQSCLGRERIFEHFSRQHGTPVTTIRLNYAVELRYGILLDVAQKVFAGTPVPLAMGNVNVVWQGDANSQILRSLALAESPPRVLNIAGPETVSIRALARRFGQLLGKEPIFEGDESPTALLSNASQAHRLFGYPQVTLDRMIEWIAHWVKIDAPTLGKPTHYEEREGKF